MKFHYVAFKSKDEDTGNDHSPCVSHVPYLAILSFEASIAKSSSIWLVQRHLQNPSL